MHRYPRSFRPTFWTAALFVLLAFDGASALEVKLRPVGEGTLRSPIVVTARAPGSELEPIEKRAAGPGSIELTLEAGRLWEISAESEETWSPGASVFVTEQPSPLTLDIYPATRLVGRVQVERGYALESPPSLRFRGSGSGEGLGERTETCELEDGAFSCRIPATELDIRFRAQGFASKFFWNVDARARKDQEQEGVDLGTLELEPGASIFGTVETADGSPLADEAEVSLAPMAGQPLVGDRQRKAALLTLSQPIAPEGFFHLTGLSPGSYRLTVSQPGYVTETLQPVTILGQTESEISKPLVLARPLAITVSVHPQLDPSQQPWQLEILAQGANPGHLETVKPRTRIPESGELELADLDPGTHFFRVFDDRGSSMLSETVELSTDGQRIELELELVAVEGEVLLDDTPLSGEVWFGGKFGPQQVRVEANEVGWYEAVLPRSGPWNIDVQAESPRVRRRLSGVEIEKEGEGPVRLDLELEDFSISGEIVDTEGQRVRERLVLTLWQPGQEAESLLYDKSSEEGTFEIRGLEEGLYQLSIEGKAGGQPVVSEVTSARAVKDSGASPLQIVVSTPRIVRGIVRSDLGPVPLAKVVLNPLLGGRTVSVSYPQTQTDIEGRFEVRVPDRTETVDFMVFAPGHGLGVIPVREPFGPDVLLEVSRLSGSIDLLFSPPEGEQGPAQGLRTHWPVLFQGGKILLPSVVSQWALAHDGIHGLQPGRWRLPALAPGAYRACELANENLQFARWNPGLDPSGDCVSGFLQPGATLELVLGEPGAEGAGAEAVTTDVRAED